tara:strand:+ start:97 stop:561 length:465 start_codon:yes stop_codon:yes gene_type:complete
MKLDNAQSIRIKIMDFLARREHTSKEIFQKMEKKVKLLNILREQIQKLEDEGLLDNKRFAEQYIHSRSSKGYGPLRIRQELIQKGVDETTSQNLMGSQDWSYLAKSVLEKKTGKNIPKERNDILKIKRFLNYRGFNHSHIEEAFSLIRNQENDR